MTTLVGDAHQSEAGENSQTSDGKPRDDRFNQRPEFKFHVNQVYPVILALLFVLTSGCRRWTVVTEGRLQLNLLKQEIASAQQQISSEIRSLLWRSPLFLDVRSEMRVAPLWLSIDYVIRSELGGVAKAKVDGIGPFCRSSNRRSNMYNNNDPPLSIQILSATTC